MKYEPREILQYHRKSRQDDPSKTVEEVLAQHRRIAEEWEKSHLPERIPEENVYMERVSGETIKDRLQFQKVLKRIESDEIKAVFVIELQRLSRGDLEDAGHIINIFRYTKTKIITPYKIYDLNDSGDRMIVEMELKQGNMYLEYTKAILKRGKDDAVKRGIWVLSVPPYGYDIFYNGKIRTLKPNPEQAPVVKKIFELYAEGYGDVRICNYLNTRKIKTAKGNTFDRGTIRAIILNPVYIGKVRWNGTKVEKEIVNGEIKKVRKKAENQAIYEGLHEAIISVDLWEKAQKTRGSKPHVKAGNGLSNPLAGIVRCGKCGKMLRAEGTDKKGKWYSCFNRAVCKNGGVASFYIHEDIKNAIQTEIENITVAIEKSESNRMEEWEQEIKSIKKRIEKLDEMELKQWSDRYESDNPMPDAVFVKLNQKLVSERNDLKKLLAETEAKKPKEERSEERLVNLQNALTAFESNDISTEELNRILKKCIERIEIKRDIVENRHDTYEKNPYEIKISFIF